MNYDVRAFRVTEIPPFDILLRVMDNRTADETQEVNACLGSPGVEEDRRLCDPEYTYDSEEEDEAAAHQKIVLSYEYM